MQSLSGRAMTRQLLALIALFTGIAAITGPANAAPAAAMACEIGACEQVCDTATSEQSAIAGLEIQVAISDDDVSVPAYPAEISAFASSVLQGVDRALE